MDRIILNRFLGCILESMVLSNEPEWVNLWMSFWNKLFIVGDKIAPRREPKKAARIMKRKFSDSVSRASGVPICMLLSTMFPNKGACPIFESRETSNAVVTKDSAVAIFFVFSPANRRV